MKRTQMKIVVVWFLTIYLLSCNQKNEISKIGSFDISQKDQKIIFSWRSNNTRSILETDSNGNDIKELVAGSADTTYSNPRFSVDDRKIVFIGKSVKTGYASIYTANADGSQKTRLTFGKDMVSDVFYASCEPKIYFVKSLSYDNYSPISEKGLHDSDLYSISLSEGLIEKVTAQNSYNMYKPSELNCDTLLVTVSYPSLFGLTLIDKKNPNNLIKIHPKNNPRQPNLYDSPTYSKSTGLLFFLAPYEMYVMDFKKREASMIVRDDNMIENFRLVDGSNKIIYTNSVGNTFYITDFNGKELKKITLDRP